MEILFQSEYQDLYKISNGILLAVNKFKRCIYNNQFAFLKLSGEQERYSDKCLRMLTVLTKDYYYEYLDAIFKAGQVIYRGYAVELTDNPEEWQYEIATDSNIFTGNYIEMLKILEEIQECINKLTV